MSVTPYLEDLSRGTMRSHAAVRLADEGVPIGAIARALKMPFGEAFDLIQGAKARGQIVSMPSRDWPPGQVRFKPAKADEVRLSGPNPIRLDEARSAIPFEFRLTTCEAEVLAGLMTRELATKNWLHGILYGDDRNGGAEPKIIDVFVCKLRRKLSPFQIEIVTVWGRGYRITAETRNRIIARKLAEREAA